MYDGWNLCFQAAAVKMAMAGMDTPCNSAKMPAGKVLVLGKLFRETHQETRNIDIPGCPTYLDERIIQNHQILKNDFFASSEFTAANKTNKYPPILRKTRLVKSWTVENCVRFGNVSRTFPKPPSLMCVCAKELRWCQGAAWEKTTRALLSG